MDIKHRVLFGGNFGYKTWDVTIPIGSMYCIYANIWGILMVNVTIYSIHGSYGINYGIFLNGENLVLNKWKEWGSQFSDSIWRKFVMRQQILLEEVLQQIMMCNWLRFSHQRLWMSLGSAWVLSAKKTSHWRQEKTISHRHLHKIIDNKLLEGPNTYW